MRGHKSCRMAQQKQICIDHMRTHCGLFSCYIFNIPERCLKDDAFRIAVVTENTSNTLLKFISDCFVSVQQFHCSATRFHWQAL